MTYLQRFFFVIFGTFVITHGKLLLVDGSCENLLITAISCDENM